MEKNHHLSLYGCLTPTILYILYSTVYCSGTVGLSTNSLRIGFFFFHRNHCTLTFCGKPFFCFLLLHFAFGKSSPYHPPPVLTICVLPQNTAPAPPRRTTEARALSRLRARARRIDASTQQLCCNVAAARLRVLRRCARGSSRAAFAHHRVARVLPRCAERERAAATPRARALPRH